MLHGERLSVTRRDSCKMESGLGSSPRSHIHIRVGGAGEKNREQLSKVGMWIDHTEELGRAE